MKNLLLLLIVLLTTSCATFTVSTLNHDPIYEDENYYVVGDNIKVDTLNEFQFRNKLRTDIGFRLDFARYALSQPVSFDWNNRLLGRQYDSRYNSYYWNRDQMWNDWAWGYTGWNSWGSPHRWSPFGYDRWGYGFYYGWNNHGWGYNGYYGNGWNNYGWNNYGWNNYYGQNNWYGRRGRNNVSYINGRRGSTMTIRDRIGQSSMIESTKPRVNVTKPRVNVTKPRVNNTRPVINTKPKDDIRTLYPSGFINSNPTTRPNNTRPRVNNTRPRVNNSRPVINRSTPTRTNGKPNRNNNTTNRRNK